MSNPCKGRETGCAGKAPPGHRKCKNCRAIHNARENARRVARREASCCTVCGEPALVVAGVTLKLCATHRAYYAQRRVAKAG